MIMGWAMIAGTALRPGIIIVHPIIRLITVPTTPSYLIPDRPVIVLTVGASLPGCAGGFRPEGTLENSCLSRHAFQTSFRVALYTGIYRWCEPSGLFPQIRTGGHAQ